MGKFFSRLFFNFFLSFFFIGFGAILSFAVTGEPYGVSDFWAFTVFFTVIYQMIDYFLDWKRISDKINI